MPLYEFLCNNPDCEIEEFEVITGYDDSVELCPKCGEGTRDRKSFYQFDFRI